MPDYINELNVQQREAVLYDDGPSLVIAGAGSGKTRVLTYKIAHLIESGYRPWNILALTFTNKAAREMKERIAVQVGDEQARRLWMGTFHSVFLRILHAEAQTLGFTPQFTIYDAADSKSLIRSIIKELQLDEKLYKPGMVQGRISNAKNHLVTPDAYASHREAYEADCAAHVPAVRDIYRRYWDRCRQADAMDFDDLLLYTFLLFRDHADVLARYQEQFLYVLVDEYQDTNFAQHCIVLQLTHTHQRVCVVGDDAQSIYSFRGAEIDNILKFAKVYPNTRIFKLEQNYRSTKTIVRAANSLIEKNRRQIRKEVFSEKESGDAIGVFRAYSDTEEGDIVTNKIAELHRRQGYAFSDFAILYRTNAQSRIFEETLRKCNIPYRIYGGLSFYQRKEIKDVIAYFRLVVNPHDEEALKRIINYPARGIGQTTVNRIITAATDHNVSLWTAIGEPLTYGLNFNRGTAEKLQTFRRLISSFMDDAAEKDAYETGTRIVQQAGIINDVCQDNTPENLSRKENIEELMNGLSNFVSLRQEEGNQHIGLTDFLSEVSLITDQDNDEGDDTEKVTLMTIHSAKGLEFKNVFVVGMEENLFPSNMCSDSLRELEEERRLFYVALTRAEEHCFLSYAKSRYRYGKMEFGCPSRFLKDIDRQFLNVNGALNSPKAETYEMNNSYKTHKSYKPYNQCPPPAQTSNKPSASSSVAAVQPLRPGQLIEHERFGIGEVLKVEGEGDNVKAAIRFQNAGDKQLLLRFARFKVVG